jgi:hypothetical protein
LSDTFLKLVKVIQQDFDFGISGAIYTQLTDVESELNGLMTYDREVIKISASTVREAAKLMGTAPNAAVTLDVMEPLALNGDQRTPRFADRFAGDAIDEMQQHESGDPAISTGEAQRIAPWQLCAAVFVLLATIGFGTMVRRQSKPPGSPDE